MPKKKKKNPLQNTTCASRFTAQVKKKKKNRKRETARSLAIDPKESCLSKFIDRCKHNYVLIGAKI